MTYDSGSLPLPRTLTSRRRHVARGFCCHPLSHLFLFYRSTSSGHCSYSSESLAARLLVAKRAAPARRAAAVAGRKDDAGAAARAALRGGREVEKRRRFITALIAESILARTIVLLLTAHPLSYFRYSSVRLRPAGTSPRAPEVCTTGLYYFLKKHAGRQWVERFTESYLQSLTTITYLFKALFS